MLIKDLLKNIKNNEVLKIHDAESAALKNNGCYIMKKSDLKNDDLLDIKNSEISFFGETKKVKNDLMISYFIDVYINY